MRDRRLRFLWNSNSPWSHSGYSVQTRDLLKRFTKDGWKLAASCFYGLEGGIINYDGYLCYPKMGLGYGADACFHHQEDFKAHCVFTFQNVWPIMRQGLQVFLRVKNWIPYLPVEHYPLEGLNQQILKHAYRIITLSKFGYKALKEFGLQSTLILEATDIDIFKPMNKQEQRKGFGIPQDIFLFGMVAANKDNPPRKSFQHVLDAFAKFHKKHPKSGLYFHVLLQQTGGFPIQDYVNYLKIGKAVYFTPPYQMMFKSPHPVISRMMNMFDVLLNPSAGEGFGLPIIESQACGVPVIVNNWTSMPELVKEGETGEICKIGFKRWVSIGGYRAAPDLDSLYDKMELLYKKVINNPKKVAADCRKYIVENYDINKRVKEEWTPFLEQVQKELCGLPKGGG